MTTKESLKLLVVIAAAAVSIGAVAAPKTPVAPFSPTSVGTPADAIQDVGDRPEDALTIAFVRSIAPASSACVNKFGGKPTGKPTPVLAPNCSFRFPL